MMEFMKAISLANECLPEFDEKLMQYNYKGASPDEVTLVEFSRELGFI